MRLKKFLEEAVIRVNLPWINNLLETIKKQCVGKSEITILNYINKAFAEYWVNFKLDKNARLSSDDGMFEAEISYASASQKPPFGIEIVIHGLSCFEDKNDYEIWANAIFRILKHEMLHREQSIRAKLKNISTGYKSRQEYLGNYREIMALAYETYLMLLAEGLRPENYKELKDFSNLEEFLEYFDINTPERKLFLKYLYQYFEK